MRPRERERTSSTPPDSPPPPVKGSLSSLVVKPSADELARSRQEDRPSPESPEARRPLRESRSPRIRPRRLPSDDSGYNFSVRSASLSPQQRTPGHHGHYFDHSGSPQAHREIRSLDNDDRFYDHSPTYIRGRGRTNLRNISPRRTNLRTISPSHACANGRGRPKDLPNMDGYGRGRGRFRRGGFFRGGGRSIRDISPPMFLHEREAQRDISPGYEKGRSRESFRDAFSRSREKFRDVSPLYAPDRVDRGSQDISPIYDCRTSERRYSSSKDRGKDSEMFDRYFDGSEFSFRNEAVYRNNPNIPPRVGDWICRNTSCGNLNFARRDHCNNCNKFRYVAEEDRCSSSPRRQHPVGTRYTSPRSPSRPVFHGFERETNGHDSPTRDWPRGGAIDFPPRHGRRISDTPPDCGDYRGHVGNRGRDIFNGFLPPRGHGTSKLRQRRRGYDHDIDSWGRGMDRSPVRSLQPKDFSHASWDQRERDRSPMRSLQPKDRNHSSFGGRGRGVRSGSSQHGA